MPGASKAVTPGIMHMQPWSFWWSTRWRAFLWWTPTMWWVGEAVCWSMVGLVIMGSAVLRVSGVWVQLPSDEAIENNLGSANSHAITPTLMCRSSEWCLISTSWPW